MRNCSAWAGNVAHDIAAILTSLVADLAITGVAATMAAAENFTGN
ncbi:MAG: hypothetical protein AAB594_01365 [Patescibacteria group bacterium]